MSEDELRELLDRAVELLEKCKAHVPVELAQRVEAFVEEADEKCLN